MFRDFRCRLLFSHFLLVTYFTVTLKVLLTPLQVTVIFAVPFFFPVTTPLEDTVAIFLLDEVYFTVPIGVAVALIVVFFPTLMLAEVLASFNVGVFTVTVQVAV